MRPAVLRAGSWVALFLVYLAIACMITYPLITALDSRLLGHPFGDAYEYTSMTWWLKTALQTGRDPFYHSLIAVPDGASALWLWSAPLQSLPTLALSALMPLTPAFNLAALLTLALNGIGMFILVRRLHGQHGRHWSAAFVAGAVWLAYPAIQGHLGAAHTGLITLWGAPLWAAALIAVGMESAADDRRAAIGRMVAAALLFPVALAGNPTLIIYLIAPVGALILLTSGAGWRRVLIALILGGIVWLPLAAPFILEGVRGAGALAADVGGAVRYSAPALAIVAPAVGQPLSAILDYPRAVVGREPFELTGYIGIAAAGLCAIALLRRRESRRWFVLAIAAWIVSLGALLKLTDSPVTAAFDGIVTSISLPWALLQDVPGLALARTPARFNLTVGFAVAVMVGYGVAALIGGARTQLQADPKSRPAALPFPPGGMKKRARATLLAIGLVTLLVADYQTWFPVPTTPGIVPDAIRVLGERSDIRAILDVPTLHPLTSKEALFLQTGHGLPILLGHVTRRALLDPAKAAILENTLDPALLDSAQADAIILHRQWDDPAAQLETRLAALAGVPIYEDDAYVVYLLPGYEGEAPAWTTVMPGTPTRIERDPLTIAVYAPAPTGALFTAALVAVDGARDAVAALDGVEVGRWTIDGSAAPQVWIAFTPGYHTLMLALDPPCAAPPSQAFRCRGIDVESVSLTP